MVTWKRIGDAEAGFIYSLSESLAIVEWRNPGLLQPVDSGLMVIASDYSGHHKGASHEAYSFLVTTDIELSEWLPILQTFRTRWLPDGRRLSFKRLGEPVRWRALVPFFHVASCLRGNVITFLIDHRIESFIAGGAAILTDVFPDCFPAEMPLGTKEKMLRLASFLAMLTAGLRKEDQRSLWISDHDETLATYVRREQFGRLASYLTFGCSRWLKPAEMEFGTTESPSSPSWAEDAASIPDLIAGAYCKLSHLLPANVGTEHWIRVLPSNLARDRRARAIGNWMATARGALRHVLLRLELNEGGEPRTSAQFYSGALMR